MANEETFSSVATSFFAAALIKPGSCHYRFTCALQFNREASTMPTYCHYQPCTCCQSMMSWSNTKHPGIIKYQFGACVGPALHCRDHDRARCREEALALMCAVATRIGGAPCFLSSLPTIQLDRALHHIDQDRLPTHSASVHLKIGLFQRGSAVHIARHFRVESHCYCDRSRFVCKQN